MTIQAINNTGNTLTYSAESITLTAGQTVTIPTNSLYAFFTDPNAVADITAGNLSLSDTVTTYSGVSAFTFIMNNLSLYLSSVILAGGITVKSTPAFSALSPSSPTAATVGITSAQALASNASRKGLVLVNSSKFVISLGLGVAAVLNSGITLAPGGVWVMDSLTFTTAAINAIASGASSNLCIQEFA